MSHTLNPGLSKKSLSDGELYTKPTPKGLMSFTQPKEEANTVLITLGEYLALIDWTGRVIRNDHAGSIPEDLTPILQRLGVAQSQWLVSVTCFEHRFYRMAGGLKAFKKLKEKLAAHWSKGMRHAFRLHALQA